MGGGGEGGGWLSVVVVHQKHKPTLRCRGARAIGKFRKDEEKRCERLSTEVGEETEVAATSHQLRPQRERQDFRLRRRCGRSLVSSITACQVGVMGGGGGVWGGSHLRAEGSLSPLLCPESRISCCRQVTPQWESLTTHTR